MIRQVPGYIGSVSMADLHWYVDQFGHYIATRPAHGAGMCAYLAKLTGYQEWPYTFIEQVAMLTGTPMPYGLGYIDAMGGPTARRVAAAQNFRHYLRAVIARREREERAQVIGRNLQATYDDLRAAGVV